MNDASNGVTEGQKPMSNVQKACENLVISIDYSKGALNELLYLKENVLKKSLSKDALAQIDAITSGLHQTVADLEEPLNELVSYVSLSSAEGDKTMALHKLQANYDKKCRQLDIALHQLAKCYTQTEKLSKERRIQNWERLFLSALGNKTPIRQWRFLVPQIIENAEKGNVHFSAYIDNLIKENQMTTITSSSEYTKRHLNIAKSKEIPQVSFT